MSAALTAVVTFGLSSEALKAETDLARGAVECNSYKIDKRTFSTWAALMHASNASSDSALLWLLEFPPIGRKRIEAAWHAGAPQQRVATHAPCTSQVATCTIAH